MTNYIVSSGVTSGIALSSGDTMSVFSSGTSLDITVYKGGQENVYDGGVTKSSLLSSGGQETVGANGTSDQTTLTGSGSKLNIESGGIASNTDVGFNCEVTVYAGGKAYGIDDYTHGQVFVSGGIVYDSLIADGYESLSNNAQASGTIIRAGTQNVDNSLAFSTVVSNGGDQVIVSGGVASSTVLSGGGQMISGGNAYYTSVLAAGGVDVEGGGSSTSTTLYDNGGESVYGPGAESFQTYVSSGGFETVYASGTTYQTTISAGGSEVVSSGGTASRTILAGGKLEIVSGGKATGSILFSGTGGELLVDSKKMPTGEIENFKAGDSIVLAAVHYSAGDTATVEKTGVVTVSAGGKAYNLHIAGTTIGETDFTFGPGSILTRSAAPQMNFLRPPASAPDGLARGWSAVAPSAGLTALDFAPKILGGVQSMSSSSHFAGWHSQETPRAPMVIPVSITQPF